MECFVCCDQLDCALTQCCYQPVCSNCQDDLTRQLCLCGDDFSLIEVKLDQKQASADLVESLDQTEQANLAELITMENFYASWLQPTPVKSSTKRLWALPQPPKWYYQAGLKNYCLAQDRLASLRLILNRTDIKAATLFTTTTPLPRYSFQAPGHMVKSRRGHSVMIDGSYLDYVLTRPDLYNNPEFVQGLSSNPNLTWAMMQAHPEIRWRKVHVSGNPNLTWADVAADILTPNYFDNLEVGDTWSLSCLSGVLDWADLEANWTNPQLPLGKQFRDHVFGYELSRNPTTSIEQVLAHRNIQWDWRYLSQHPNMTWSVIQDHPELPWRYSFMAANPNITLEIVQDYPNYPWSYYNLATNPNITWDMILANPQLPWDVGGYCWNPNLTWSVIDQQFYTLDAKRFSFSTSWYGISKNPAITWSLVQEHMTAPWSGEGLSENPNITWAIVEAVERGRVSSNWPEWRWHYNRLCHNPMRKELHSTW